MNGLLTVAWVPVIAEGEGFGALVPIIIVVFFVINVLRALHRARQAKSQHDASGDESSDERRAREIRERLRRVIVERRTPGDVPPAAPLSSEAPPVDPVEPRRAANPPLDPFGGPLRRVLVDLERTFAPPAPPPPVLTPRSAPPVQTTSPVFLESAAPAMPGLPPVTASKTTAMSVRDERGELRAKAREELLSDLHETGSLRRAFILREVLGPPVGLR